jgi:hypothetical protein
MAVVDVLVTIFAMSGVLGAFMCPRQSVLTLLAGDLAATNLDAFVAVIATSIG